MLDSVLSDFGQPVAYRRAAIEYQFFSLLGGVPGEPPQDSTRRWEGRMVEADFLIVV